MTNNLRIFGLGSSRDFARDVAKLAAAGTTREIRLKNLEPGPFLSLNPTCLQGKLNSHHEERRPDGEVYTTALDNVRGCDVFVISSLYGDEVESVDEKLVKTLVFIHTLHHASADRITLVAPYLSYMRQDRKTESRAPIATQAVAMMMEAAGVDRLLTMDVHNLGAEQNAFRVPIDNLEARKLLADAVAHDIRFPGHAITDSTDGANREFKVLSPDAGGTARTKAFQHSLSKRLGREVGIVYADKTRIDSNTVKVQIVGNVAGSNVIVVDDMIGTGGTVTEVVDAAYRQGGRVWGVVATHGLYVNGAAEKLANVSRIYTVDTVDPFRLSGTAVRDRIKIIPTATVFAEAIRRIHLQGGSISELLND